MATTPVNRGCWPRERGPYSTLLSQFYNLFIFHFYFLLFINFLIDFLNIYIYIYKRNTTCFEHKAFTNCVTKYVKL